MAQTEGDVPGGRRRRPSSRGVRGWRGSGRAGESAEAAGAAAAERVGMAPKEVLPVQPYPASENRHLHVYRKVNGSIEG